MGYSDDLENTAALSEFVDGWVRGWTRRYVSRRNRQRRNGRNRAVRGETGIVAGVRGSNLFTSETEKNAES